MESYQLPIAAHTQTGTAVVGWRAEEGGRLERGVYELRVTRV